MRLAGERRCLVGVIVSALVFVIPAYSQHDARRATPPSSTGKSAVVKRTDTPTLEETGAWLKQKLESLPEQSHPITADTRMWIKYDSVTLEGKALVVEATSRFHIDIGEGSEDTVRSQFRVPLGDLDPKHIAVVQPDPDKQFFRVDAATTGGNASVITRTISSTFKEKPPTTDETSSSFRLIFSDRDSAERVAKALAHAAELCGAKAEPF